MTTALITIAQTSISVAIILLAWGNDGPIFDFALVVGGILLGHVLTEVLNENEVEGEEA